MSLYYRMRNDSINPQLQALKKEEENHQTSFVARPTIRGVAHFSGPAPIFGARPTFRGAPHFSGRAPLFGDAPHFFGRITLFGAHPTFRGAPHLSVKDQTTKT